MALSGEGHTLLPSESPLDLAGIGAGQSGRENEE